MRHYENIYDLPDAYGHAVHDAIRRVAIAMYAQTLRRHLIAARSYRENTPDARN